jgi:alpha-tubulin suppressor-like RCC1 family protein
MRANVHAAFRIGLAVSCAAGCPSNNNEGGQGGSQATSSSCSFLDGTWTGWEVDQDGHNHGAARVVVGNNQAELDVSANGAATECYTMTASCNPSVDPNQMTGTITSSNQAGVAGLPHYGIWEVNPATHTGRYSLVKPGAGNSFPTTFVAGVDQRLFVFDGVDHGGSPWACGTSSGGATGSGGASGSGGADGGGVLPKLVAKSITAGGDNTYGDQSCALLNDGRVLCWGCNKSYPELPSTCSTPAVVSGITDALGVSTSGDGTCVVSDGHTVLCWGRNGFGQLGDGTTTSSSAPIAVSGIMTAVAVAVGGDSTCALLGDGRLRCWGLLDVVDGTVTASSVPVPVSGITNAIAVTVGGAHTCAVQNNGSVHCWGDNSIGQLGDGTSTNSSVPVAVSGITTAVAVSAAATVTCALLGGGSVQCWGDWEFGQLGYDFAGRGVCGALLPDGSCSVPVTIPGITTAIAVAAGGGHVCAVLGDGSVQCWGSNATGQLGNGTKTSSHLPVTVPGITTAVGVAAGNGHTCVLLSNGSVQCWGSYKCYHDICSVSFGNLPVTVTGF